MTRSSLFWVLVAATLAFGIGVAWSKTGTKPATSDGLGLDQVVLTIDGRSYPGRVLTFRRDTPGGPVFVGRGNPDDRSNRFQLHGTFRGERFSAYLELDGFDR